MSDNRGQEGVERRGSIYFQISPEWKLGEHPRVGGGGSVCVARRDVRRRALLIWRASLGGVRLGRGLRRRVVGRTEGTVLRW